MKLSAAIASVALVLSVCSASPSGKNEILPQSSGHESVLSDRPAEKFDQYGCDEAHTSSVWGKYIPDNLQGAAKVANWNYNKYLGSITKQYRSLLGDTKQSAVRVNGIPAPQDRTFDYIPVGSFLYTKMVNVKTENLATLQNKSLDIDFVSKSALLSMASTEKIHLTGQLMNSDGLVDSRCQVTIKPGVRFQLQMNMREDEQGRYHVAMNQCKFVMSEIWDASEYCDKTNDGRDAYFPGLAFDNMATLLCRHVYFEQVKDQVEQHIHQWHPSQRAETYASTEIYKLMEKFRDEKLKNNIEMGQSCVFEKKGYKINFEDIKFHGQEEHELDFHSTVPAAYTLDHSHHVDMMLMTYKPLIAEFGTKFVSESDNHTSTQKVGLLAPVKIALHFSINESDNQASFALRYHPDVMFGGVGSFAMTDPSASGLIDLYEPSIVDVLTSYVQKELFEFLYPGALRQGLFM